MKRIVTMLSALLTAVTLMAQTGSGLTTTHDESGYVPEGYELAWSDEFDGDDLNTDDWKTATLPCPSAASSPKSSCLPSVTL